MAVPPIPDPCEFSQLPTTTVTGIYFLWAGDRLVYVGQSKTIGQRLCQHIADRTKTFNRFSYLRCNVQRLNSWERQYIEALTPRYNNCGRSNKVRRLKARGMQFPKMEVYCGVPIKTAQDAAAFLGVTDAQFSWLRKLPEPPRQIRIPRVNAKRWSSGVLENWKRKNAAVLEQAQAMVFD